MPVINNQDFHPLWWLPGGHAQTIGAYYLRKARIQTQRERMELPDSDFIDLDWIGNSPGSPIVLLLHGLGGSVESHYAKGLLHAISQRSYRGAIMHFRGCSGQSNRLAKSYHAGETLDLQYCLNRLKQREPNTPIVAIGVSLGGNVLLKFLGENPQQCAINAAVAVSVPFDLGRCAKRLQQGFSRVYQWWLLRKLKQHLARKQQQLNAYIDYKKAMKTKTIEDFDDRVTAPLHGFKGVKEYYQQSSSRGYLKSIASPTLIIHAMDDPFISSDAIPKASELSQQVKLFVSERGGHVGFLSSDCGLPGNWLEQTVLNYLEGYIAFEK